MNQSYFGKYRGVVTDIDDPAHLGRLRARVPDVLGDVQCGWALPCFPIAGKNQGLVTVPSVGAWVWIEFEHGDPSYPIWSGSFYLDEQNVPEQAKDKAQEKIVLKSAGGHLLLFDDDAGSITIQTADGQKLVLNKDGIELDNGSGATIKLANNKVAINGDALEVQ